MRALDPQFRVRALLFHCTWIAILAFAAHLRFSFPQIPLLDHDYSGFLGPGIWALLGHGFDEGNSRQFLYPGFIYAVLKSFGYFRAIPIMQHLLGLAAGVLMLASWLRTWRLLPPSFISKPVYDGIGIAILACYLLTPYPIYFECFVRPDVLCPFFAALTLFLGICFLEARHVTGRPRAAFVYGAAAFFFAFLLPYLKPSYWLTAILCTGPVWATLFTRRESFVVRVRLVLVPLAAIFVLLVWPQICWDRTSQTGLNAAYLPESVFSIHALMIREQLAADIARPDPAAPYTTAQLQAILELLDAGIAAAHKSSPADFKSLGYDADYLLIRDPFFSTLSKVVLPGPGRGLAFCRYYYWRTWRERPLSMLSKVASQLALFYGQPCPAYPTKAEHLAKAGEDSRQLIFDNAHFRLDLEKLSMGHRFLERVEEKVDQLPTIRMVRPIGWVLIALQYTYTPSLILFVLSLLWVMQTAKRRKYFGLAATVLAVGYAFNFGNNFGIALLHTLEVSRYTHVQYITTIFSQAFCFVFLIAVLRQLLWKTEARKASLEGGGIEIHGLVAK